MKHELTLRRWVQILFLLPLAGLVADLAQGAAPPDASASLNLARQLNQVFIEVAERVSPAVVVVRVAHKPSYVDPDDADNPLLEMLPPEFRRRMEEQRDKVRKEQEEERKYHREPVFDGQGSGVVIRKEGYILTNRHVVDGAEKIKVRFRDGTEFAGEVRGVDAQSDVAVIKIDPKGRNLDVAKLADSDKTRVGEFAIAIGAPFDLDYSVTFGHVSAKGRSRIINDPAADQDFIQTDANINPGNSGGPLVNIDGEIIGINTLIRGLRTGIGFAIPSNLAREVSEKLITDGKFVRAYLGVQIRALKEDNDYRDAITGVEEGVVVVMIPPETPAKRSDLRPGDVITAVDGKPVASAQQLKNEIRGKKIGAPVTLDVVRFGKSMKIEVKPEAWPDEATPVAARRAPTSEDRAKTLGLTVQPLTKDTAEQFGIEKMEGVLVSEVERGSDAERKGIKPGDVITEVSGKPISTVKQFQQAMKAADVKKGVILILTTRGTSRVEVLRDLGE
jgi:serine protease Do